MRRGPFPKARPNEADPRCYDQGIPWGVPTTRTRRTSLSRPFSFFFQPEGGTMPPDTLFSFFSPTHTRSHTLPPHQKTHTPGDVCAALQLRVDGLRWAGQEKLCRRGERKEGRGHPRARAHGRPPIFFPSWLRHQAAGGRALFLCRDPARRSSSHRLPSRAHAGEGGPGPGPPPATSHSRGGPCVPGRPDTPAETRTHALTHFCCSPPLFLYRADCQH